MASSDDEPPENEFDSSSEVIFNSLYGDLDHIPSDKEVALEHGFYLGSKLGSGSYSEVRFAATQVNFNRVAIKIMDRRKAPIDYQQTFLPRELSIAKSMINPNIIRTYHSFEEYGKIYQVQELAEGGDLLEYVRTKSKGPVGMTLTRKWVLQAARALGYMQMGLVAHRDIKCENLLLDDDQNIKVSDFGFAKRCPFRRPLSKTFCGSAAYAAPEILRAEPYNPLLSDVWALGVVAYVLATGYMPFGDDVRDVSKILAAQQKELEFPPATAEHISEECKSLIRSMLVVDVSKRPDIHMVQATQWLLELWTTTGWPRMKKLKF